MIERATPEIEPLVTARYVMDRRTNWRAIPADRRFWSRVTKSDGCWPWTGYRSPEGYGEIIVHSKKLGAHVFAYQLLVGAIPPGQVIDHTCHNADPACPGGSGCLHRGCVNPAHLEPVSIRDNILRGKSASAVNARRTACQRGHPFDGSNTYQREGVGRECRECRHEAVRRYRAKRVVT